MWDSATKCPITAFPVSRRKAYFFGPMRRQGADKLRKGRISTRGNMLVQSVDVEASGSDWSVIIQPHDRYSKVDVLLSLTNKHLYLAVASSSLGVHASLFLQVQSGKGRRKIGNGLGDQPLRTGIPCSRSTSDEAQQEPAHAQGLPFNEQNPLILSV